MRFLYIAKGSLAEVITQTIISREVGYLTDDEYNHIVERCEGLGKMLGN